MKVCGSDKKRKEDSTISPGSSRVPALVVLVASLVLLIPVLSVDKSLFLFLNSCHTPTTDSLWLGLTGAGDGLLLAVMISAFLVINPRVTALGLAMIVLSSLLVHVTKGLLPTARPAAVFESIHVLGPVLRSGSFPSGHTAATMAAALAVAHYCPSMRPAVVVVGLAALIGLSRVFVGAHFPGDVLGGLVIASASYLAFAAFLWHRWEPRIPDKPQFAERGFRGLHTLALLTAIFTLLVYGPFFSDWPGLTSVIAMAVVLVLVIGRLEFFE